MPMRASRVSRSGTSLAWPLLGATNDIFRARVRPSRRGRQRDQTGAEPAGGDPFQIGQSKNLFEKCLVVLPHRLPGEDVVLQDVLRLDLGGFAVGSGAFGEFA